jgi:ribosomal-protein-alanine N-acetyltransferase
MIVMETDRLILRWFAADDAPFILTLLNEPGWIRFIGDRGVDSIETAAAYIETKLIASYRQHGFGLYAMQLKEAETTIGMCGLVKRDGLDDVDIGFALLAAYEGRGYAKEAANATLNYARDTHKLHRLVAITNEDNISSIKLLEHIGMAFEKTIMLPGDNKVLKYYAIELINQDFSSNNAD